MNDFKKHEYFRFLFRKANKDLLQYEISYTDKELINNLFNKLSSSENLLKDLYILSHVKELKNIGKYFIFILKKIEDNVINFDNFTQNVKIDSVFIEKELLKYFSDPELKKTTTDEYSAEKDENSHEITYDIPDSEEELSNIDNNIDQETENEEISVENNEDDEEIIEFRKNYLELIQTGETDEEIVFELPKLDKEKVENTENEFRSGEAQDKTENAKIENENAISGKANEESAFDLPSGYDLFSGAGVETSETDISDPATEEKKEEDIIIKDTTLRDENANETDEDRENIENEETPAIKDTEKLSEGNIESSFIIKKKFTPDNFLTSSANEETEENISETSEDSNTSKDIIGDITGDINEDKIVITDKGNTERENDFDKLNNKDDEEETDKPDEKNKTDETSEKESNAETIKLSDDIKDELNLFDEDPSKFEEEYVEEEAMNIQEESVPANAVFMEYEDEVNIKNDELDKELDIMIYIVNANIGDEEHRNANIKSIIEKSTYLENISREMSLEIISNIYQTITFSFEKISDGKYDLSEGTLNLFKKGLSLVNSLIKGDDYFGYKDILKSIENIRNSLIEEKEKRKLYERQQKEKLEIEKQLLQKYPDDLQKRKIKQIKQLIKDTEINLNSLDKISGEYQMYEALRSLSVNLSNLKEIVILSKELNIRKLGQLSEASYIFIKFLQNYRINPVSGETKEIFGYIIYNMKSVILNKQTEDIDEFISYLNDPVKIFSKKNRKKS